MTQTYTTVAVVQEELGIGDTDGSLLARLVNEASSEIDQRCSRAFFREIDHVENVPGYGTGELRVSDRLPVVSILSIVRISDDPSGAPETVDSSLYAVDNAAIGTVRHSNVWDWTSRTTQDITRDPLPGTEERLYQVTYTGGYVTRSQEEEGDFPGSPTKNLPFDIERATIDLVVSRYRQKGRDKSVVSEKVMSASTTYNKGSGGTVNIGIPPSVAGVVMRYGR